MVPQNKGQTVSKEYHMIPQKTVFSGNIQPLRNEKGFVLVASLMILVVLTVVGITATNTSFLEMLISGNDRFQKQTFYQADAGTEVGINLVYENALCLNTQDGFQPENAGDPALIDGNIWVDNAYLNFSDPSSSPPSGLPSDANRVARYYTEGIINDNSPHTNLTYSPIRVSNEGAANEAQVSGYLGLGYGSAGGGASLEYTINSQHQGVANSESIVSLEWGMSIFLINTASTFDCIY